MVGKGSGVCRAGVVPLSVEPQTSQGTTTTSPKAAHGEVVSCLLYPPAPPRLPLGEVGLGRVFAGCLG